MPRPTQRTAKRAASALLLTLTSFGLLGAVACDGGDAAPAPKSEPPPAAVELATAASGELVDEWIFVGEVRSLRSAALALGAGGEIVELEVREGDRVEAGQLLVQIDKREATAQLSAAVSSRRESESELQQARRQAERATKLGASVIASEEIEQETVRADTLEARKRRLAAEIRAAKAQLSDYQLLAPFAGVVAVRHADLGQWLNPGETVLELVATDEIEILVDVRPELAPHLRVGERAKLRPAGGLAVASQTGAGQANEVEAEVIGVVPALDRATRTLKVRLRPLPPNPDANPDAPFEAQPWLIPGAPVEVGFPVAFTTSTIAGAVIVPRDALVLGAVDTRVIVVIDDAAKPIVVDVLATADGSALITGEGLVAGSVVVTRGNERLRPGQAVRDVTASAAAAAEGPST